MTRLDGPATTASASQTAAEWDQWGRAPPKTTKGSDTVVGDESKRGPLSLIIIGAGVVAGGSGVYFGVKNSSAKSDYNAAQTASARTTSSWPDVALTPNCTAFRPPLTGEGVLPGIAINVRRLQNARERGL